VPGARAFALPTPLPHWRRVDHGHPHANGFPGAAYHGDVYEYDLERYLTIRSAHSATLGSDGTLAFLLDTTGVPQVWTLEEPGAWPRQRTFYEEAVSYASYSPERPELLFGMDEGGNERIQLHRLDPDGTVVNLTATPDAKHQWGGWSHDGDRIAFASNRRDESVFDVYLQGRDERGEAAEMVHRGDGYLYVAGWSPADDRLVVGEAHASYDQDLFVLDLETRELAPITPHEGEAKFGSPGWSRDGEGIYLVTDYASDTLQLCYLDVETAMTADSLAPDHLAVVRDGGDWNVDGVAVDHDTDRVAYSRNVEGYTELHLGRFADATTIEEYPVPALAGGTAGGVTFDRAGDRLALSASSRTRNTNVHVVDLPAEEPALTDPAATVGDPAIPPGPPSGRAAPPTTRWTDASTAGIPAETFRDADLIRYETFDGREIPALVTLPESVPPGGAPVVVDVHGGPEAQRRPSFSGLLQFLVSRGYAVLEPNVRGSSGYGKAYTHLDDVEKRLDSVADLDAAADWLAEQEEIDGDRIAIKGGSYGGFMVLSAMTEYPDRWAAGVDVVGIANLVTFLENTGSWRREHREAEYGSLADDREFLEEISPVHRADRIAAPLFVVHGANDPRVPVEEAAQIADAVAEAGPPVEKLIFEDEGHGLSKLENRVEAYTSMVAFLDEHV
jgi:dipeptidyl aminopeptidase/acylaminoacyl peptidase